MLFEKRQVPVKNKQVYSTNVFPSGWLGLTRGYIPAEKAIQNSDVWAAVTIISSDIARTFFHSNKPKFDKLLQKPSALTNRFNFFQSIAMQLLLDGNAYAVRRTDEKEKGEWWEFVPPYAVTIWLSDDGQSISYDINFTNPNEPKLEKVDASDVLHFKWASLNGGISGQSPLMALSKEINLQDTANALSISTMTKAITPTSILKSTAAKLSKAEREAVREQFEYANTGANSGRTLVLDGLFDYQSVSVSPDIAKLLDSASYTRDQIAKAFMIPPTMLGNEASHSNLDMIRAEYGQTFGRYLAAIVEELENKLGTDIATDVHLINDMDGSILETRVIALNTAGIIDKEIAQAVLANSQSDILDANTIATETAPKETDDTTDETAGQTEETQEIEEEENGTGTKKL